MLIRLVMIACIISSMVGCATVNEISSKPGRGGELSVAAGMSSNDEVNQKAAEIMSRTCPNGYRVTERGQVVVGKRTTETQSSQTTETSKKKLNGRKDSSSRTDSSSTSETSDVKDYRVKYNCK